MAKFEINVRIPQLTSIETAIKIYYSYIELSNANIKELFGNIAPATISKLKAKARQKMIENETPVWNANYVNTEIAFKAWGLDIVDLERRYHKLKEYSD